MTRIEDLGIDRPDTGALRAATTAAREQGWKLALESAFVDLLGQHGGAGPAALQASTRDHGAADGGDARARPQIPRPAGALPAAPSAQAAVQAVRSGRGSPDAVGVAEASTQVRMATPASPSAQRPQSWFDATASAATVIAQRAPTPVASPAAANAAANAAIDLRAAPALRGPAAGPFFHDAVVPDAVADTPSIESPHASAEGTPPGPQSVFLERTAEGVVVWIRDNASAPAALKAMLDTLSAELAAQGLRLKAARLNGRPLSSFEFQTPQHPTIDQEVL